ncbi:bola-like protein-domain-containing protein [Ephemerocybe angulata]|uniref:Bola-like protein-domain-containing protein n=1 Tax=Ephemerocybe angulata TaxID=980116 RepID=A0A8H6MBT5_9AGAR|nr:bola-like protein-domain-containing protein [Tulosesus angulatus]
MKPDVSSAGPVQVSIQEKVSKAFLAKLRPEALTITNDSWQHRHHAAMREDGGGNGETHFTINIVSDEFKGKSSMQRHRMIYSLLSEELAGSVHALSLHTKTTEEVQSTKA